MQSLKQLLEVVVEERDEVVVLKREREVTSKTPKKTYCLHIPCRAWVLYS
jgi:hypothetical protein